MSTLVASFVLASAVQALSPMACTMDAKLCPDGETYVGREGPNCEFAACPGEQMKQCNPHVCADGTTVPACTPDGHVISYFADPCRQYGEKEGAPFEDVTSDHANADAIFYVKQQGIVEGYQDGTYKPDNSINRAEFVKILVGAHNADAEVNGGMWEDSTCIAMLGDPEIPMVFSDVSKTAWYAGFVCRAHSLQFIEGHPDGTFRPANPINFAEAAKIIVKAFGLEASTTLPACEGECPWYRDYVLMLEMHGAIPASINAFDQHITRGEMAEMIWRLQTGNDGMSRRSYEELLITSQDTSKPRRFSSEHFTLSFDLPAGMNIIDEPDGIAIARFPYSTSDIGSNNIFFSLSRFNENVTYEESMTLYRNMLINRQESTIAIDGSEFPMLEGDDWGRYEGTSAGRIVVVFFPKSFVEIQEHPAGAAPDDPIATGKAILRGMTFSK